MELLRQITSPLDVVYGGGGIDQIIEGKAEARD
jgi:hypothetical protein